jgi:hypothetical protein
MGDVWLSGLAPNIFMGILGYLVCLADQSKVFFISTPFGC